jgi:2-amino-4-hydroxy-6-hydroxymethyldihydropteridine diphosphokinase
MVYLCLGSNLGDRQQNLWLAVHYIKRYFFDVKKSRIIETEPLYGVKQPSYLNQIIKGRFYANQSSCFSVSAYCHSIWRITWQIQKIMGRMCYETLHQSRIIDIDLLKVDNITLNTKNLILPHPRIQERAFVLELLSDL